MEYQDKIVLITGAGSGIGKEGALHFAKEGATVVVSDIDEKNGSETTAEINAGENGKAVFMKANIANPKDVEKLISDVADQFGRIDVAINNAGILSMPARTIDTSHETWNQIMSVNASGTFYCLKAELVQMMKQGGGVILNTASVAGLRGFPNNVAYAASKHAIVGMTKTAAMEYAGKNIRINALCPVFTVSGMFNPELTEQLLPGLPEKLRLQVPMRRFADASEMAEAMLWLCSDRARFVTGVAMPIDGGLTA